MTITKFTKFFRMNKPLKYADLHVHLTLKPFLNTTNNNYSSIWKYTKTSYLARSGKARTNMQNIIDGRVKVIFPSLGYIEKGWQVIHNPGFKVPAIFRNVGDLIIFLLNVNMANIDNYFDLLIREMNYLMQQRRPPMDVSPKYKSYELVFPLNESDFDEAMEDNNKIIALPSIEGAHALISGILSTERFNIDVDQVLQNVVSLKNHALRPLFITFTHHFYNGLAGHAHSIYKFERVLDQQFGMGNPISPEGWRVIRCLLGLDDACGSWPILVDTKHFSLAARRQYYDFVSRELDYSIPIINSHAAYSGSLTIENVVYNYYPFSHYQTNISAEEVYHIWRSKGLVGINFDQKVLWSDLDIPDVNKIMENIVSMVQGAIEYARLNGLPMPDETIWDVFCIGSDFDGFINPLDDYTSPLDFEKLEGDLLSALKNSNQFKNLSINLHNAKNISEAVVVQKFMHENVEQFVRRYFSSLAL